MRWSTCGALADRGPVVYVMRQRSWVDYLLVTYVLTRDGLPQPEFANDIPSLWFRPIRHVLGWFWHRFRRARLVARELREFEARDRCRRLVAAGRPVIIFMRGKMPRMGLLSGRRRALRAMQTGGDYLREIVHHQWTSGQEVSLVPIAVLRGRGMRRKESRLATLVYSVQEMPGELRRLISLLWNRHDTTHQRRRGGAASRFYTSVPARRRGAHRAPADSRAADLPVSRGAARMGASSAARSGRFDSVCSRTKR